MRPKLPYPVFSLLPDFESSEEFPLFLGHDPHWNPAGARLAARSVVRLLTDEGLVPCDASAGMTHRMTRSTG